FKEYFEAKGSRLKLFRSEALRAGFKKAWQAKDFATIVRVGEKIPERILQEDDKLSLWYDNAVTQLKAQQ
ncbi:MAG: site-specific DNA-methyltransferase, partial [bacterium]|nr:site-specific DNA-methyltransferase [bacterium]